MSLLPLGADLGVQGQMHKAKTSRKRWLGFRWEILYLSKYK